ncbi:MAG: thioredoxin [Alphaproteobacteria bacterium]|nr:thioredoxin [Alphaproteobacteria bacterium]
MDPIVTDANIAPAGALSNVDLIKDSNQNGFAADVLEASREIPVIVDFWAPWCGPCKTLGPIIEKVVQNAGGAVRLVKIDIDKAPDISAQLKIQSIPMVYAFKNGQPVDGFQGALPESQVQAWVDKLIKEHGGAVDAGPDPIEEALSAAETAMTEGDIGNAGAIYAQVLNQDAENTRGLSGMIRAYLKAGQNDKAREIADQASPELLKSNDLTGALSALELAEAGSAVAGDIEGLRSKVEANPDDHQARFDFAVAAFASNDAEGAIEALVEIIRRKRDWNEDGARTELLKIFEALGPTDPLTNVGRRKLSSVLFS